MEEAEIKSKHKVFIRGRELERWEILDLELVRSRETLKMLKNTIGPDRMKDILAPHFAESKKLWKGWAAASKGKLGPKGVTILKV